MLAQVSDAEARHMVRQQTSGDFHCLTNHYPYSFLDDNGKVSGIIKRLDEGILKAVWRSCEVL
ncbi:hypothetical protein OK016_24480 [Vibrio chagasii]|nr:hypothetical protein [Vibrio chagasii]